MITERRRYIRFLPINNAFAALGVGFSRIGKIIDISIGGLAFGYLSQFEIYKNDFSKIAIFTSEKEFHLPNLPCKVAFEIPLISNEIYLNSAISVISYRCGVQFTDSSRAQFLKLEHFIANHTRGFSTSFC